MSFCLCRARKAHGDRPIARRLDTRGRLAMAESQLSSYEQQRLDNIASNEAHLVALGLTSILPKQPSSQPRPKRPKRGPQQTSVPERRSSRVQGAAAPNIYVDTEAPGGAITVGGNSHALADQREREAALLAERAALKDPLTRFGFGEPPETDEHLLPGAERKAFAALYKVKRAKAQELKIEGYKIAQHRSLCDVVRTNPADATALSACWGFGGSGVRLQKYGDMFLAALAPHAAKVAAQQQAERPEAERRAAAARAAAERPVALPAKRSLAAAAGESEADKEEDAEEDAPLSRRRKRSSGGGSAFMNNSASDAWDQALASMSEAEAEAEEEEDPVAARRAAFLERFLFAMPEKTEDLLPEERRAYEALVAATHVRAEALGERWVWNIAMSRSLLEMTRRLPTSLPQLRAVWGFGGSGVRAERHGDFLLEALRPHLPSLRAAHAAAARGEISEPEVAISEPEVAPEIEPDATRPHGGGRAKVAAKAKSKSKVTARAKSKVVVRHDDVSSDDDDAEAAAAAAAAEAARAQAEKAVPAARRPRPRQTAHAAPAVSAKAAPASKQPAPERRRTRVSSS